MHRLTDIASRPVRTVGPDDSLDQAIRIMEEARLRHLPVVRRDDLVGMVSERDILSAVGGLPAGRRRGDRETTLGPTRVSEIMSPDVLTLPVEATLPEAARLVVEHKIGAIPLLKAGRLEAIVSDTDLLRALRDLSLRAPAASPCHRPLGEYMTTQVLTVVPDAEIAVAAEAFRERRFRHLPVLEEGKLVGLASDRDVRRAAGLEAVLGDQSRAEAQVMVACTYVRDVMSAAPVNIAPTAPLSQAAHVMLGERLGSLCVVEHDILVGIITGTDLLRVLGAQTR